MDKIAELKSAFEAAAANDGLVTPDEWRESIKTTFMEVVNLAEIPPLLNELFLKNRKVMLLPPVFSVIYKTLTATGTPPEELGALRLLVDQQQLICGALLALASDADGLTAAEWTVAFNERAANFPGAMPLRHYMATLGATPINFLLYSTRVLGKWIDPKILDLLDDPTKTDPAELVNFGVNAGLVTEYRKAGIAQPPPAPAPATPACAPCPEPKRRDRARNDRETRHRDTSAGAVQEEFK